MAGRLPGARQENGELVKWCAECVKGFCIGKSEVTEKNLPFLELFFPLAISPPTRLI